MPNSSNEKTSLADSKERELAEGVGSLTDALNNSLVQSTEYSRQLGVQEDNFKQEVTEQVNAINQTSKGFLKESKDIKEEILASSKSLIQDIFNCREKVENWIFYGVLACFVLIEISILLAAPSIVQAVLVLIAGSLSSVFLTLKLLDKKFRSFRSNCSSAFEDAICRLALLLPEELAVRMDFSRLNTNVDKLAKESSTLRKLVVTYSSAVQSYYKIIYKREQLRLFKDRCLYVLASYDVSSRPIKNFLDSFYTDDNSEEVWTKIVNKEISGRVHVSEEILELCFAEYMQTESLPSIWSKISSEPKFLKELAELLCRRYSNGRYFDIEKMAGNSALPQMLKEMPYFSLAASRGKIENFCIEIGTLRRALISTCCQYNMKNDSLVSDIDSFVPNSIRPDSYIDEFFELVAKSEHLEKEAVSVFYFDENGEASKRKDFWASICSDSTGQKLKSLVSYLIDHKKVDVTYDKNIALPLIIAELKTLDDYSLPVVQSKISHCFLELGNIKTMVLQSIEHFTGSLDLAFVREVDSYLPNEQLTSACVINWVAEKSGIPKEIVNLFYLSYTTKGTFAFDEAKKNKIIQELAEFLVKCNRIEIFGEKVEWTQNIAAILSTQSKLDLLQIQSLINKYFSLTVLNKQLAEFLLREELVEEVKILSFDVLIDAMKISMEKPSYDQMLDLTKYMMKGIQPEDTSGQFNNKLFAILAIFAWEKKDNARESACKKAAGEDLTCSFIYQYYSLNESKIGEKQTSLKAVFQGVIDGRFVDDPLIGEFRQHLWRGYIIPHKQELIDSSVGAVKRQIEKMDEVRKALTEYQDDVKTVLKTELKKGAVDTLLNSNSVCAYLITTTGRSRVISQVIDGLIEGSFDEELTKKFGSKSFKNLLLYNAGDHSAGFYTRIGLVPLGMPFSEFGNKFEAVFKAAKQVFLNENSSEQGKDYTIKLSRIIPSASALKTISESSLADAEMYNTVSELMVDKFGLIENVELVVSATGEEPGIKVRKLVETAINSSASIYTLISPDIQFIVEKNPQLKTFLTNGSLERELKRMHKSENLSDLAIAVNAAQNAYLASGNNKFGEQFLMDVAKILQENNCAVDQNDLAVLSNSIMVKLCKHGKVLSTDT